MNKYFGLCLLILSTTTHAQDFCSRSNNEITQLLEAPEYRIGFKNDGGLINGGVCWWHSRLQRSSVYLAKYAPEKSRPSIEEAQSIILDLIFFRNVVEIPGYSNFSTFSKDYESMIQAELNNWQLRDAFISQEWIRGLYGRSRMPASTLKNRMNHIYQKFLLSKPGMWAMIQLKGITSHAMLFIGMTRNAQGYHLRTIDSNYPDITREFDYHYGDQSLDLDGDDFIPYVGFTPDQDKINETLSHYCRG